MPGVTSARPACRRQTSTSLPVCRVCVSRLGSRPGDGTSSGNSCSTVHRPEREAPAKLLVGGAGEERGGRCSSLVASMVRGCGEKEDRLTESRNSSSVFV